MKLKKAISPVVATALLLVVAVVAVVGFQGWFNTYSSGMFTKTETQSNNNLGNTQIENLIGNSLYFKNGGTSNVTVTAIKINNVDCNYTGNLISGVTEINVTNCVSNLTTSTPDVVIYTSNAVYSEKFYVKSVISTEGVVTFSGCSLNGTIDNHLENSTFYNSSSVPFGSSCSSQVRTCSDGTYNGTGSYNVSSCQVLTLNCSALGLSGGSWITVPGNVALGTQDFCVMKFDAKNLTNVATSQAALTPWISINQIDSRAKCAALGSKYHLITNAEWTTIARNAELVPLNWNSTVVGSGFMFSGHNDNNPANGLAVSNENDYYDQTLNSNISGISQKRIFILNNSEIIWDLSGNVWQWNNDTCSGGDPWYSGAAWIEWTNGNIIGVEKTLGGPIGNYSSTNGVGKYLGCNTNGNGFLRGGAWNHGVEAGSFALNLLDTPLTPSTNVGFRCSYSP